MVIQQQNQMVNVMIFLFFFWSTSSTYLAIYHHHPVMVSMSVSLFVIKEHANNLSKVDIQRVFFLNNISKTSFWCHYFFQGMTFTKITPSQSISNKNRRYKNILFVSFFTCRKNKTKDLNRPTFYLDLSTKLATTRKRGIPLILIDSARKERKRQANKDRNKRRILISDHVERWKRVTPN